MADQSTEDLLDTWLAGWAACRGYRLENAQGVVSAVHADEGGRREHFLCEPPVDRLLEYTGQVAAEPGSILTVVTNRMAELLPAVAPRGLRVASTEEALLTVDMDGQDVEDPPVPDDALSVQLLREPQCRRVLVTAGDESAASGSVSVVGEVAVFDRIETAERFRRRGLGTFIMRALTATALEDDVRSGLLMASADGRHLYQHLGWTPLARVFVLHS